MVEHVRDLLKTLSVGDLRQLLAIKETQPEIERLIQRRNDLLRAAEGVQRQIDELIMSRCRGESGRRISYGRRIGPTIRQMCEVVMLKSRSAMSAAEVKNCILERWPERDSPTLYNQVFIALGRSDLFKKVKKGKFALREATLRALQDRKDHGDFLKRIDEDNGRPSSAKGPPRNNF